MQDQPIWSPSQLAAQRVARRRSTYYATLNLWPFVGVMMALVFIFIPHSPHTQNPPFWKAVDVPRVAHPTAQPDARREDAVWVSITRDGNLFVGKAQVQRADLALWIRGALRAGSPKKLFMNVDARAKYGNVKIVLDHRGKIRLLVRRREGPHHKLDKAYKNTHPTLGED